MAVFTLCRQRAKVPAGQIIFTSSQTWEVPKGVKKVDVFLVGGAGGGGRGDAREYTDSRVNYENFYGGGGGGGYTATYLNVDLIPKSLIDVIIGEGGAMSNDGSPSSFGELSVNGGKSGKDSWWNNRTANGGDGGSGGGAGGSYISYKTVESGQLYYTSQYYNGGGGANGANGGRGYFYSDGIKTYTGLESIGQGTTTRAFGEPTGTLYASGGAGGAVPETNYFGFKEYHGGGGNGSSTANGNPGIVIVRWAEQ